MQMVISAFNMEFSVMGRQVQTLCHDGGAEVGAENNFDGMLCPHRGEVPEPLFLKEILGLSWILEDQKDLPL